MTPEVIVGILLGVALVVSVGAKLMPAPKPASPHFNCARCKALSRHTPRTIEAWRNKKTRFYCQSCHGLWLQSHPNTERTSGGGRTAQSRAASGCFGVLAAGVMLPAIVAWLWSAV